MYNGAHCERYIGGSITQLGRSLSSKKCHLVLFELAFLFATKAKREKNNEDTLNDAKRSKFVERKQLYKVPCTWKPSKTFWNAFERVLS